MIDNKNNKNKKKNNKSGHSNISFNKNKNKWVYQKTYYGNKKIYKRFKSKTDTLCYKYIMLLRIKEGHLKRS